MGKHRFSSEALLGSLSESPALMDSRHSVSFREQHQLIAGAASWMKETGIERQERVAIIGDNSIEYVITLIGLFELGAVACPVSTRNPASMTENCLRNIKCEKVISSENYRLDSRSLEWIPMPDLNSLKETTTQTGEIDMEQEATILFTSGTTSEPKAVLHTFGNHYYNALGSNLNIELMPGDRWLLSLPLYHVGGLGIVFRGLLSGATVVFPESGRSISGSIDEFEVTHLSLVPTQVKTLLEKPPAKESIRRLKSCLVGGGVLPRDLIDQAKKTGLPLFTTYGLTEMASQVTTTAAGDDRNRLHTSGRVLKHREIRISDEGEIHVKGKTLFKGYVTPAGIETPFDNNGWFATGDLGKIAADGYLVVTGRKDNMFVSGGENIYPEEIEEAIQQMTGVDDVIVVPIDDEKFGQRPVAFVKHVAGKEMSPEILLKELGKHLPKFKIPIQVLTWPDEVPRAGIKSSRAYFKSLLNR